MKNDLGHFNTGFKGLEDENQYNNDELVDMK